MNAKYQFEVSHDGHEWIWRAFSRNGELCPHLENSGWGYEKTTDLNLSLTAYMNAVEELISRRSSKLLELDQPVSPAACIGQDPKDP